MILSAYSNIEKAELERNNNLLKSWRNILESINSNAKNGRNLGANLYSHSRIIDLKNEILLIETDHPAWTQTLKFYQKYILTGLKRSVPELKISLLAFRLKGTNAELHNQLSEEKIKSDIKEQIKKEDEILQNFERKQERIAPENSDFEKPMPQNLQDILSKLKNDILNDEKC